MQVQILVWVYLVVGDSWGNSGISGLWNHSPIPFSTLPAVIIIHEYHFVKFNWCMIKLTVVSMGKSEKVVSDFSYHSVVYCTDHPASCHLYLNISTSPDCLLLHGTFTPTICFLWLNQRNHFTLLSCFFFSVHNCNRSKVSYKQKTTAVTQDKEQIQFQSVILWFYCSDRQRLQNWQRGRVWV